MDLGLKGKSVLVTAASKGLGKASALEFAREGAKVTIASRNLEELKRAAGEIELATGQKVTVVQMDVTREEDIERAVKTAAEAGNGLDVLVTNAGGPPGGTFDDFADEAWMGAFELNLLSAIRLIRTSLPYMRAKGGGRIVTITSTSIKQPIQGLILSNTIRAGVNALTKSLSVELAKDQILVNTVAPGRIATDRVAELDQAKAEASGKSVDEVKAEMSGQIPLGRYGLPEEFGRAVAFLGSFANTYITGQALLVDGGMVKAL
ncbi:MULTISPECIES: SDR family oxidoreductase [Thermoactinomyces]|jgi:3-oxoacyl-[acyl-carrier protein] reductase|uniref:SDR family oxidoreductase n=1 Tax=Thermoactinomyces daqus TaxID=1329516 RepID=A0A7W2AIL9_9BACL|nr:MULTISPECIES: SDR family oxidoreductase [Thermoactinomyces]MBA4543871.1 SDR family oxidoreductase [Thermoactinomyces daqus]MBH8599389.1 SDR family oxidoreductase [Thermoactinomyces sp. CICC 10523]MBH8605171.1 SDR family oxidoreductase [Thermoactinomyces sp. CICC 10522]MBH8608289.1 SDR family oxidoreductase [Thermoactinomyces sp. CICC 10521]